jgi:hypothetical protein
MALEVLCQPDGVRGECAAGALGHAPQREQRVEQLNLRIGAATRATHAAA